MVISINTRIQIAHALLLTWVFLLIFFVIYIIHIWYFKVNVIFYAALLDSIIAVILTVVFLFATRFSKIFLASEKLLLTVIWILLGYSISISVPTVIDRSLSLYILEKIDHRGGGIRLDAFEKIFTKEYMVEHHFIDIRLTEQLESGTIKIEDKCVRLTNNGYLIAQSSRWFRQNLLAKHRQIFGDYSDKLTDPFRNSLVKHIPEYSC
jgi:small basic protein